MSYHLCLGPKLALSLSNSNQIVQSVNSVYQNIHLISMWKNIRVLNFITDYDA
jgi:hypothetical protein